MNLSEAPVRHLALITDAWHPQINGVVTTLDQIVKRLTARGWQVTVIHPAMFKTCPAPRYPEVRLAINPWRLKALLAEINPTHIHVAVEGPLGLMARLLLHHQGLSYTTAYHTNFPQYLKTFYRVPTGITIAFIRWFHRFSSSVLASSQSTARKLRGWGVHQAVAWGRGFDDRLFYPIEREKGGEPELLYVGRVSDEKNITAFLRLQRPGWRLTVVGDGPARPKLERQFPAVRFVGFRRGQELAAFYQRADVLVFPSLTDTLGVVMIEAMACGTPVAAYRVEGPLDVVRPGVNGFLDESDLERCVELALGLDRATVAQSAQQFSWESACDIFEGQLVVTRPPAVTISSSFF